MNDKNKAIEEMARVLCDKCLEDGNPCGGAKRICITTRNTATTLYNAGYRKVNEGDIVLTKEENKQMLKDLFKSQEIGEKIVEERTRKETAKEILQELLKKQRFMLTNDLFGGNAVLVQNIKQLAEKYGVEVE